MMRGVPMALGVTLPLSAALVAIAPGLGWGAHLLLMGLLLGSLGTGRLLCRVLGLPNEPLLALVVGYATLAHALLLGDLVADGAHPAIALAFLLLALTGISRPAPLHSVALACLIGLFVLAWCWDIAPRLAGFEATGRFDFWIDLLVHTANLQQFTEPAAIGRGMMLMSDWPRQLYHTASLMPVALLPPLVGITALDTAALVWIPLGMVVMAAGVVSLGIALRGPSLAAASILALALLPNPEHWTLDNGLLGFAWLLETSPGTTYSLGVGCAALASLAHGARDRQAGSLFLAVLLTASCFLIRANTFIWLAPTVVLGALASWHWPGPRYRLQLVLLGLAGFVGLLVLLSWQSIITHPRQFLFGYVSSVHISNSPTRVDWLLPAITPWIGKVAAGSVALLLVMLGTLGLWLPAGLVSGWLAWRRGLLTRVDALPFLLLLVAAVVMVLSPISRNGDISEYRHRAGPLLVAVWAVWTLHFAGLLLASRLARLSEARRWAMLGGAAVIAIPVLALTIGGAKRPTMDWGQAFYGTSVHPDLMRLAPRMRRLDGDLPRFAVANQPADSRNIDDAARLAALSGMPAYLSCPGFLIASGGAVAQEATRRMEVLRELTAAPDLEALRSLMRQERITHYIVTAPGDAAFDPGRAAAAARFGDYAVYLAWPSP
jgi:hypothetical protein